MRESRIFSLVLLLGVVGVFPIAAQQTETDRRQFEETKADAEAGDATAQCALGACYAKGVGVARDWVKAGKWYRKAADQNDAVAQFLVGDCYAKGLGVKKDAVEAVKWYRKAADQNFAAAQVGVAGCYANGEGVKRDEVEAVKWYRKAADQNFAAAQYALGAFYGDGEGVKKDAVEEVKWYRKAADQNLAEAQFSLGVCYANGEGVKKNEVEAVKWYSKAADQNHIGAQYNLGLCYATGHGVTKDYVRAYMWWLLAGGQGNEAARKNITAVESRMTRDQIAEGQQLARNFKPREVSAERGDRSGTGIAEPSPEASGSGFFITEDGYLITNNHVAGVGAQVRLVTATGITSAKVVKVDAADDLALLKAEGRFTALPVASSRSVKLGSTVATIGFPNIGLQGFAPKFGRGEIGSLSGANDDARYFQISVPVQPGNSGGALVDERGNVVGVVWAKLSAQAAVSTSGQLPENVNYAVKSSFLLSFLESVPEVTAKLKEPNAKDMKPEEVAEEAKEATALVLVY